MSVTKDMLEFIARLVDPKTANSLCMVNKHLLAYLKNRVFFVREPNTEFWVNIRNQKHGKFKRFYDNGRLWVLANMKNGITHGQYREYYSTGQLWISSVEYDEEQKNYKQYRQDGTLIIKRL